MCFWEVEVTTSDTRGSFPLSNANSHTKPNNKDLTLSTLLLWLVAWQMRLLATFLRERNQRRRFISAVAPVRSFPGLDNASARASNALRAATGSCSVRTNHTVAVQLDYFMSPQFGGIASALVGNRYEDAGLDVTFLPTCPPGLEMERVRQYMMRSTLNETAVGTVEQNIFIPTLRDNPNLQTTAVAAMFRSSPLCVASLRPIEAGMTIGAHSDTVELLGRIFPQCNVVASSRSTKNTDLLAGNLDAIQAYTTTEVPTLHRMLKDQAGAVQDTLCVTPLEGLGGTKLGYSQLIFAADECLNDDRREVTQAFLDTTFKGWSDCIRDPDNGVRAIQEAKRIVKSKFDLDDEGNDHWYPSEEFQLEMLKLCGAHTKQTFQGDRYGVLSPRRWQQATDWLLEADTAVGLDAPASSCYGMDETVWQPPSNMLAGSELGRTMMEDNQASAEYFCRTHGRKPSLAVVSVGHLERYAHADRRLELYSHPNSSWFTKKATGNVHGFDVQEIQLEASTTNDELLSQIYKLQKDKTLDGIQVMRPLPNHIDTARVYNAIDISRDVDGMHFVGQTEIGNANAYAPVSPRGAMDLMKEYGIELEGTRALVIGRSPIVGSPMAHLLRQKGAVVTVAHSLTSTATLEQLVRESNVIVTAAGEPGLVPAEWISPQATVLNIGTTFVEEADTLMSDISGDLASVGCRFSPVPGGVGPLGSPMLFQNTVRAAWDRSNARGPAVNGTWTESPPSISKTFHFPSYTSAIDFVNKVNDFSTVMDHHPNMTFSHRCVDGVDVNMEYFTYDANAVTEKDYESAKAVELLYDKNAISMSDFTYDLEEGSIALYPADPRGSSKLLHLDAKGEIYHYGNFSESICQVLPKGAHLVFNESRVLDARLFVKSESTGHSNVELMILDLGSSNLDLPSEDALLQAMIRFDSVKVGDTFEDSVTGTAIVVEKILSKWIEEEASNGNGMECLVRIRSPSSIETFLGDAGSVPIPPYLNRGAEVSDKDSYNNVYAATGGSVAAPTAGLHFTQEVLDRIGAENCSQVTLHVGAGTFKPVSSSDAREHPMHAETFSVSVGELRKVIAASGAGRSLAVVGTTSARTLESLFWMGIRRLRGLDGGAGSELELGQFDWAPLAVGEGGIVPREAALEALVGDLDDGAFLTGRTSLMITPGHYRFRCVDTLITNFHAPDSTLMLLVSAFVGGGSTIRNIYEGAQLRGFKFLSYGDVCVFSRPGAGG